MERISLSDGSGGKEMNKLISSFSFYRGNWKSCDDDSAIVNIDNKRCLVFTTDSFVVDPIFFPGGNIGDIAVCGTINDIAVMGAKPLGISLALIIEEGFPKEKLYEIIRTINKRSLDSKVPVVTGDTKVMESGKIEKIVINTSAAAILDKSDLLTRKLNIGDKLIISGGIGEHAAAILSKRFDYKTDVVSDTKPLIDEVMSVRDKIKIATDLTRGGISANLNEIAKKNSVGIEIEEESIPIKKEVKKAAEMLGIDVYSLASEGRLVCFSSSENAESVVKILRKFNKGAAIIGKVTEGKRVVIDTIVGKRILPMPSGRIVPRIC